MSKKRQRPLREDPASVLWPGCWLLAEFRIRSPDCWSSTLSTAPRWVCIDVIIKESYRNINKTEKQSHSEYISFFIFSYPTASQGLGEGLNKVKYINPCFTVGTYQLKKLRLRSAHLFDMDSKFTLFYTF